MRKRRIAAGLLAGVLVIGGQQVWAATTHYNDSSVTGGSQAWQQWWQTGIRQPQILPRCH